MRAPQDSTGRVIRVGDRVNWRGQIYTIKVFGDLSGRYGTRTILFEEPLHLDEVPDEIAVDLVEMERLGGPEVRPRQIPRPEDP